MKGDQQDAREVMSDWLDTSYAELRRLARARLRANPANNELDTTGLVNESVLRLLERGPLPVQDRAAYFGYVARVMRSVVIDHARARNALKRGGSAPVETLSDVACEFMCNARALETSDALARLRRIAPDLHRLIELRCVVGLSASEVAKLLGTSKRTQEREDHMAVLRPPPLASHARESFDAYRHLRWLTAVGASSGRACLSLVWAAYAAVAIALRTAVLWSSGAVVSGGSPRRFYDSAADVTNIADVIQTSLLLTAAYAGEGGVGKR